MGDMAILSGANGRQDTRPLPDPLSKVGSTTATANVKPAAPAATAAETGRQPGKAAFNQALEQVGKFVQDTQRTLDFSVDHDTGEMVVKVLDRSTKEVIRQIPSKEVLVIAKRLKAATSKGVFLDEKA